MAVIQRNVANPIAQRFTNHALLETIGRKSGLARITPIGGRRSGAQFWFVSEYGERSQYVRNIKANPAVRVRLGGQWYRGTAHLMPEDDAQRRLLSLPRINSAGVWAVGNNLLTIRVDLD